jgi:integrase
MISKEYINCGFAKREVCRKPGEESNGDLTPLIFLLEDGYEIRTVQELVEHKDIRTTMIYTHVLNRRGKGVKSPVDGL